MTKSKKTREAKPGELSEINILESIERFMRRPDSRIDLERALEKLSPDAQTYIRHLVMSGASSNLSAAKALGFKVEQIEAARLEIEKMFINLRKV